MIEHRSTEFACLRFDSSWGLRIFSLSHARDKTKNIFLYFLLVFKDFQAPRLDAFSLRLAMHIHFLNGHHKNKVQKQNEVHLLFR